MVVMAGYTGVVAEVVVMVVPAIKVVKLVAVDRLVVHMVDLVAMVDTRKVTPHLVKQEQIPAK